MRRAAILLTVIAAIIVAVWLVVAFNRPVPFCASDSDPGRNCIPYCPPDPKECG